MSRIVMGWDTKYKSLYQSRQKDIVDGVKFVLLFEQKSKYWK
jgi:hypothetical protein